MSARMMFVVTPFSTTRTCGMLLMVVADTVTVSSPPVERGSRTSAGGGIPKELSGTRDAGTSRDSKASSCGRKAAGLWVFLERAMGNLLCRGAALGLWFGSGCGLVWLSRPVLVAPLSGPSRDCDSDREFFGR